MIPPEIVWSFWKLTAYPPATEIVPLLVMPPLKSVASKIQRAVVFAEIAPALVMPPVKVGPVTSTAKNERETSLAVSIEMPPERIPPL